ncbi:hypothetical protein ATU3B_00180 [Agrobacterium genomosp. 3 str. CIP 111-78]|uniref:Uncharacterized protein n=1 Tax=Agrobacterium tumefaciens TaxID=358 RepID=A0AAE6BTU2_AGRTU|nr:MULTISPECIES: hypothetical protein [Agrobacterium tumefaciens complex]MCA2370021.1 hypothetical protein [Agrobacterium tomkonis CIP 111-78]QCM03449.1 hypothetical protein CFBP6624_24795 [Agrobacterium tumefaciens]
MAKLRKTRAARKTEALRATLWPDLDKSLLWNSYSDDGYTPVPRTMPIVMSIIDDLTKGKPASTTFLELWCRAFNEMYVSLGAAASLATHSGYSGIRAVRMWQDRIELLDELGFIRTKNGSAGRFSHAVVLNPHKVIRKLFEDGHQGVSKEKYDALVERATEVGSDDFKPIEVEEEDAA